MFRSLCKSTKPQVPLQINGQPLSASQDSSVWTAMALAGMTTTRLAPVTEQPRSAYCAMGVCFECLVEIDGVPNRQACLTEVQSGMRVELQRITETTQSERPVGTRVEGVEDVG